MYPDDVFLPPTGAQRGSLFRGKGDPLTPGYPAIGNMFKFETKTLQLMKDVFMKFNYIILIFYYTFHHFKARQCHSIKKHVIYNDYSKK